MPINNSDREYVDVDQVDNLKKEDYTQTDNVLKYEENLSEPSLIVSIENGCPICASTLKGNAEEGYYCEKCNMLFTQSDLMHLGMLPATYK